MTTEVNIGGQTVKLRATGNLPIAYRLCFNRDLLRDMDQWREKLSKELEASKQAEPAPVEASNGVTVEASGQTDAVTAEASEQTNNVPVEASGQTDGVTAEVSEQTNNVPVEVSGQTDAAAVESAEKQILYSMDLILIARLAFCMAKSADPSIPGSMTEWLDTLESPNALYILTGEVLQLYNAGFQTTVEAKKNIPPQLAS